MDRMSNVNLTARLEALLFYYGEPISYRKAASILEEKEAEVREAAKILAERLSSSDGGIMLLTDADSLQLVTRPEYSAVLQKIVKDDLKEELTPVSLETLAIVAYLQPITRAEIDYLRGVNSTFTLRALVLRGLVKRSEDRGSRGTYSYSATFDFLKHIGLAKTENLPDYDRYKNFLNNVRKAAQATKES